MSLNRAEQHISGEPKNREKVSPVFQAIFIVVSALIIILGFYFRIAVYTNRDEPIVHQPITPEKFRELGGFPEAINVGLQIDHFQDFNVTKNQFQFSGNLWFEFEAGTISLEALNDFKFERATILYRSEPDTKLNGSQLMVRYLIKVAYNSGLVFSDFPLDDHRINLVLAHPFISPEEVIFETKTSNFVFDGKLLPFGWNAVRFTVKEGFSESRLSKLDAQRSVVQPLVGFVMDVERYGARYLLAILLPIFLLYFLMFFSFSVDAGPSITVTLGGMTGILAYRYVIEQLSPQSGDLMLSDYFFFLILTSAMLIFLLNQLDLFVLQLSVNKKKAGITIVHLYTLTAAIYLLLP